MNFGSFVAGAIFGGVAILAAQDTIERRKRLRKHFDDAIDDNIHYDVDSDSEIKQSVSESDYAAFMERLKENAEAKKEVFKNAAARMSELGKDANLTPNQQQNTEPPKQEEKLKTSDIKEVKTAPEFI